MQLDYIEIKDCLTRATPRAMGRMEQIFSERVSDNLFMLAAQHGADSPQVLEAIEAAQSKPAPPTSANRPVRKSLRTPAIRVNLEPAERFRIFHPAPVVSINRYGVVRWNADGARHKAGELIPPRNSWYGQTVRFRYQGKQIERRTGSMLETVGWINPRKKKKKVETQDEGIYPSSLS